MARNVELKVRCDSDGLTPVRERLAAVLDLAVPSALDASTQSERMRQVDTYFAVPSGRLKLREMTLLTDDTPEWTAELIAYHRPDGPAARPSEYLRAVIATDQASSLKHGLAATIGLRGIVAKNRHVVIIRHTRVHLDQVDDLGAFVELETVVSDQSLTEAHDELREIAVQLGLDRLPPVTRSYIDELGA